MFTAALILLVAFAALSGYALGAGCHCIAAGLALPAAWFGVATWLMVGGRFAERTWED